MDLTGAFLLLKPRLAPKAELSPLASDDVDMETVIPSTSSIQAAKEKRERIRKLPSSSDDYTSLSVAKRDDFSQGPHPESRLVREDDELGEVEEGEMARFSVDHVLTHAAEFAEYTSAQERIALGKKSKKVEAKKRREAMKELIVDACVVYIVPWNAH